jgi:hypothetical protein
MVVPGLQRTIALRFKLRCARWQLLLGRILALDMGKCYIITTSGPISRVPSMPTHIPHQHHHHPGRGHPPASISPSILRLSVTERLAISAALIAVMWAAVMWAMKA